MNMNKTAGKIAECCKETAGIGTIAEPRAYTVRLSEQERTDVVAGLEARAEGFLDATYQELDDNPDLAYQWHTGAHQIHHLVDRIRTTDPDATSTVRDGRIVKIRELVDRLDTAVAFHQGKNRMPVEIETADGWIGLADFLDKLIGALDADRG